LRSARRRRRLESRSDHFQVLRIAREASKQDLAPKPSAVYTCVERNVTAVACRTNKQAL
jgi:hypothetical protein